MPKGFLEGLIVVAMLLVMSSENKSFKLNRAV